MIAAAIAGCGVIGRRRALALTELDVRVATVFDLDRAAAEDLAAELGGDPIVATDAAAAFSHEDVGLAVVATAHASLAEISLTAIEHDCHVIVEKPGASKADDLRKVAMAAADRDRIVRVGFNHRFHPAIIKARQLIGEAPAGEIMHLRARYGHGGRVGYETEWRASATLSGGGEMLDQGIHLIDLTRYLAGNVNLAFAELRTDFWKMDVEDNAFFALRTEGGAFAWLHASWTEWKNLFSMEIALKQAKIEITGLGGSYGVERLAIHRMLPEMGPPVTEAWEWPRGDDSWRLEVEDVLAQVNGQPYEGSTVDDGVAALEIVDEAYGR